MAKLRQISDLDLQDYILYQRKKDAASFHSSILQNELFKLLWTRKMHWEHLSSSFLFIMK